MFGCELATLCERQGTSVPKFFVQFIDHIEKEGLDVVGIYRLSGNAASVNKLRYLVEQGKIIYRHTYMRTYMNTYSHIYIYAYYTYITSDVLELKWRVSLKLHSFQ